MYFDPIVDEVRQARDQLAKKFNYNIKAICDDLRKKQEQHPERIVDLSRTRKEKAV